MKPEKIEIDLMDQYIRIYEIHGKEKVLHQKQYVMMHAAIKKARKLLSEKEYSFITIVGTYLNNHAKAMIIRAGEKDTYYKIGLKRRLWIRYENPFSKWGYDIYGVFSTDLDEKETKLIREHLGEFITEEQYREKYGY